MRLYEFQAKRIFAKHGIPVPNSRLIYSMQQAAQLTRPTVLKAQVPVGRRGKAGGIQVASGPAEAAVALGALFQSEIWGYPVRAVLAEDKVEINREIYLAMLLDRSSNRPMVMASVSGGIDIEQVAEKSPEKIVKKQIDPCIGPQPYTARYLAQRLELADVESINTVLQRIYAILWKYDATLVEINPLAETPAGLVALDAKIVLDDRSAFRHPDLYAALWEEEKQLGKSDKTRAEQLAEERNITYILLDGNVGLIADGAGTGMLTLDLIQDAGGRAANFCEMGGLANADVLCRAMEVVLTNSQVKVLLISLIGGLTRMDEMAAGIVQYLGGQDSSVPLVVRMYGTQEEVGKAILKEVGIETFEDLPQAVRYAVALAMER